MQDFSIHHVRFRRAGEHRSEILVYGQVTRDRTLTDAWKNFLEMRLALHEHRAVPAPNAP